MAADLQNSLQRILSKSNVLLEKYRVLQEECERLRGENDRLETLVREMKSQVERQTTENEYLRVARNIASTPEERERSRAMISSLVRDIDKCISQLSE